MRKIVKLYVAKGRVDVPEDQSNRIKKDEDGVYDFDLMQDLVDEFLVNVNNMLSKKPL